GVGVDLAREAALVQADRVGLVELDPAHGVARREAEPDPAAGDETDEEQDPDELVAGAAQHGAHDGDAPATASAAESSSSAPPKRASHSASCSSSSFRNSRPGGRTSAPGSSEARSSSSPSSRSDSHATDGNAARSVAVVSGTNGS